LVAAEIREAWAPVNTTKYRCKQGVPRWHHNH
jgi:hypothetical protein